MNYRLLGNTGLQVSEIGFGTWGIGGTTAGAVGYGPTDDEESRRALRRAVDLGITFFDTADFYGFGHSEELLGETLHDQRTRLVIASKVGMLDATHQDFSVAHIRKAIQGSLRRLRTDYLDLYQLHSPALSELERNEDILTELQALQKAGTIRALGISLRSPDDGLEAVKRYGFQVIQVNLNLVDQRTIENGLLDLCAEQKVGVIIRTPLSFGFLTGQYGQTRFDQSDHRSKWSPEQIEHWASAFQVFAAALAAEQGHTPAQSSLRFCLSQSGVSTVIPGMLTAAHVEENAAASTLGPLSADSLQQIDAIYHDHTFFLR